MVLVVFINEVLHDGTALKQTDLLAIRNGIRQSRDTAIGVDLKEPWLLLGVFADINGSGLVPVSTAFCSVFVEARRVVTLYFRPSSSKRMETLMPLGVWAV